MLLAKSQYRDFDFLQQHIVSLASKPPLYTSIDMRISDFKIAPVDCNIFPSGFGLLKNDSLPILSKLIANYCQKYLIEEKIISSIDKVLILHESFDRNPYYDANISNLKKSCQNFATNVIAISINSLNSCQKSDNNQLIYQQNNCDDFIPDVILLNADLTEGVPKILNSLAQPIIPSLQYGWYQRSKYKYFRIYEEIILQICQITQDDPWLFFAYCDLSHGVNFREQSGINDLAKKIDLLLLKIEKKYHEYRIKEKPHVFLKPDCGTFGMGVMSVSQGSDIFDLNKKTRHSLQKIKGGVANNRIFIQEAVPSNQVFIDNNYRGIGETLIYNIGFDLLEVFCRHHSEKSAMQNLNSKNNRIDIDKRTLSSLERIVNLAAVTTASLENQE